MARTLPRPVVKSEALALEIRRLSVHLNLANRVNEAVSDVSLAIDRGGALGLVGESGSGKTLTAMASIDLLPPVAKIAGGSIMIGGTNVVNASRPVLRRLRGSEVGVVFQDPLSALNPAIRVGEQIAERIRHVRGSDRRTAMRRTIELLEIVGIPDPSRRARHYPHQFSGGMRQRIMFALAISCDPAVLIADEPTTSLDVTTQAQIMSLVAELRSELEIALLFISHDIALVGAVCDQIAVMYAGQIVELGPSRSVLEAPQHPYTRALLEAIPDSEIYRDDLAVIPGLPPAPGSFSAGCRFGPRCAFHNPDVCDSKVELKQVDAVEVRCARLAELPPWERQHRG